VRVGDWAYRATTPSLRAAKAREAFFSFPWPGTALEQEFSTLGVSKFVPITYKQAWALVRDVDAAMNVQYTCK
jgi:phosphonate transport system substrate-binding protein